MGLLVLGTPLEWCDAEKYAGYVREHGVAQFLKIWDKVHDRVGDALLWGDEVEYMVVSLDEENKNARLSLRQSEILRELQLEEMENKNNAGDMVGPVIPTFHPEYGRYMLESTPGAPYGITMRDLLGVEDNMRLRRKMARAKLKPHEIPVTLTSFPRLGVSGVFLDPHHEPTGDASRSLFLPDQIINPHVRFPTLTANIRRRRGAKVAINMPIFHDTNTPKPFIDTAIPWDREIFPEDKEAKNGAALPDHIYLDAMGFGMGCCCVQITFQACNIDEARRVYDALVPVGPIMLALSAAAPAFRGYLADVDCRWNVIAGSVDDRTEEERGLKPLSKNPRLIPKSRYDSVDSYLSQDKINRPEYNDNPLPIDEGLKQKCLDHGLDELIANHIAHLFIRDPLVIFSERIELDDETSSDHFENIQSTNWQTIRFKPPPPGSNIGWRVEFRSMEVQFTDFENAAFSIFIVLLTRAILSFGLNFYMPISKVDDNMKRAHIRNAAREQKFYFRKNLFPKRTLSRRSASASASAAPSHSTSSTNLNGKIEVDTTASGSATSTATSSEQSSPSTAASSTPPSANGVNGVHGDGKAGHTRSQSQSAPSARSPTSPTSSHPHHPLHSALASAFSRGRPGTPGSTASARPSRCASPDLSIPVSDEYEEMTLNEIINGKPGDDTGHGDADSFPGLMGVVNAYLDSINVDVETRCGLARYLGLIERRARGELVTTAQWIRSFVRSHPAYKFDSVVSQEINFDLVRAVDEIERGVRIEPSLLGDLQKGWAEK